MNDEARLVTILNWFNSNFIDRILRNLFDSPMTVFQPINTVNSRRVKKGAVLVKLVYTDASYSYSYSYAVAKVQWMRS